MNKARLLIFCLIALTSSGIAAASADEYQTFGFPPAHELFPPLLADPTELRFAFQMGGRVSHRSVARVNVGDYLGLYRVALSGRRAAAQLNVGGAVMSRFDATPSHALQVIDYYGNVPLDLAWGSQAMRLMFYHVSSHLGDDYLRERGTQSVDTSWEALRGIYSIHPWQAFRFYGGYSHAVHTKPAWAGRDAVQGGMEIYFNNSEHVLWHPYWATDIQSWARSHWNPLYTTEIGIKTGAQYSRGRGISYFFQFMSGPRPEGQFFTQHETIWTLGLKFQLSQAQVVPPPVAPAAVAATGH
jgi:hypothetical protein